MLGQYHQSLSGSEVIPMSRRTGYFLLSPIAKAFAARHEGRRGMTLVELLVAVTIITVLMAVSIPLVRYSLESDKVREGSRLVNMMLAAARTRAIERGWPSGIWIQRSEANPNAAFEIFNCDSAAPYLGDTTDARVSISDTDPTVPGPDTAVFDLGCDSIIRNVKVGDIIRFNRTGHYFDIYDVNYTPTANSFGYARFRKLSSVPESVPPPVTSGTGLQFEVLGQPKRLNSSPLQLPDGIVVDLRHSGIGAEGTQFQFTAGDADHVIIAFDGTGVLSYLYFDAAAADVDGPVHLLVGKLEQMQDADATSTTPNPLTYDASNNVQVTYDKNLADPSNLWVSVGSRNGTITTAENAWELRPSTNWASPGPPYFANSIRRAREFAQASDATGGR